MVFPTALFAYVSSCLAFHTRFRWPILAAIVGLLPGFMACMAATSAARKRLRNEEPARGTITCAVCLWAALALATSCGDSIHRWYMFSYYNYQDMASYTNIDPNQEKGQSFMDAGQVYFRESTYVMRSKAIAFESAGVYCVAPIVRWPPEDDDGVDRARLRRAGCSPQCSAPTCSSGVDFKNGLPLTTLRGGDGQQVCTGYCSDRINGTRYCGINGNFGKSFHAVDCRTCSKAVAKKNPDVSHHLEMPASGTVDFWVAGKDCCEANGANFECGAVLNPKARAGLRMLREDFLPFYMMAVQEWSAWIGEPSRHPLFFHWVEDPLEEVDRYGEDGHRVYWQMVAMFFGCNAACTLGLLWCLLYAGFP